MNKNVLILSTTDWDSPLWFRRQHFALRFARAGWKVLYVNPSFTILRPLNPRSRTRISQLWNWGGIRHVEPGLGVVTMPPGLPLEHRHLSIKVLNRTFHGRFLDRAAAGYFGDCPFVTILYNPFDVHIRLKRSGATVYECVDEWTGYPDISDSPGAVRNAEQTLLQTADLVTTTAESLRQAKAAFRSDIAVIPNGVDIHAFTASPPPSPPPEFAGLRGPIVIYVGAIDRWFNLDLVFKMADARPDWNIVLVGPWHLSRKPGRRANLRYLGVKPWRALPPYLIHAEVGIIPFMANSLTVHVSPLKLYEYFAAGLSCVSSYIADIVRHARPLILHIAENDDSFISAVEANVGRKQAGMEDKRAIARRHSWDSLFEEFEKLVMDRACR